MERFHTTLVPGKGRPYASWTFLTIPETVARTFGAGPLALRGTIAGVAFRGTAARGDGVLRMPVGRDLREAAGIGVGDTVAVAVELDPDPRRVDVPKELRAVLDADPDVAVLYEALPPSLRRAWATYVAEAKRPHTRLQRARAAPTGIRARVFPP